MWFLRLKREASWCIISRRVDSRTGITVGAEALIRFFDEAHGVVGPNSFYRDFRRKQMLASY